MVMTDSIFNTIKHMLGVEPEYTHFDNDIITHINTAINILSQVTGFKKEGFYIEGPSETWADYLGEDADHAQMIKSCIYNRVRILFDPPLNGTVLETMKANLTEMEYRLKLELDREEETNKLMVDEEG